MLSDDVTATEILLGDLYTAFGMPDAADNVFSLASLRAICVAKHVMKRGFVKAA
jgi:hypothetical protein